MGCGAHDITKIIANSLFCAYIGETEVFVADKREEIE
jgi:hypothetical protein